MKIPVLIAAVTGVTAIALACDSTEPEPALTAEEAGAVLLGIGLMLSDTAPKIVERVDRFTLIVGCPGEQEGTLTINSFNEQEQNADTLRIRSGATLEPTACAVVNDVHSIVLTSTDGILYDLNFTVNLSEETVAVVGTITGDFTWSLAEGMGTCAVDMAMNRAPDESAEESTFAGQVCGHSIEIQSLKLLGTLLRVSRGRD